MNKAIYPGSFDPITYGHLDIIKRAGCIFDAVIIAVARNSSKDTLFSFDERIRLVKEATKKLKNVQVKGFNGLVVQFAKKEKVSVIIRGIRMISDFEYEFQMALTNRKLAPKIETMFLMPHPNYSYLSSRLVKEVASLGGDLREFLPPFCIKALKERTHACRS